MSTFPSNLRNLLPELIILIIASLTRFWRLGYHSIWFDEAVSLRWAGSPPFNLTLDYMVPVTFRLVEEKHPPVYYLMLYGWRELMGLIGLGQSDVALRSLGALLGVGTVCGVLLTVRQLSGRTVALWAGLFVALSPVLVWYSQELRMFQPAVLLIVWALYGLLRGWWCNSWWRRLGWWLLMIIGFELALYCYLFSAFVLPAAGFTLVVLFWGVAPPLGIGGVPTRSRIQRFGEGVLALAVTGGLFLPLARNAWLVSSNESTQGSAFGNFWQTTLHLFEVFTIWRENWSTPWDTMALLFFGALLVLGAVSAWAGRKIGVGQHRAKADTIKANIAPLLILIWIGSPLLLGNLLLVKNAAVFQEDRYHIYMVPFVFWGIALGVVQLNHLKRWLSWLIGGTVAALLIMILPRLWTVDLLREDWRSAANYIDAYQQQSPSLSSAGVAHINYTHQPMDWYLQQQYSFEELPIFGLFGDPLSADMIDDVIAPPLNGIVDYGAKTLWLTQSHLTGVDEQRIVEGWLREHFPVITEQYPAGVKLTGFALQSFFDRLPQTIQNSATVAPEMVPGLSLQACEVMTPVLTAQDERLHPPSGWVHLRLWWRVDGSVDENYSIRARIVDSAGVWGELLAHEGNALSMYPTSQWPNDKFARVEVDVILNPATPKGEYDVQIGLFDESESDASSITTCGNVSVK